MAETAFRVPRRASPTIPSRKSSGDSDNNDFPSAAPSKPRKATIIERVRQQYQYSELAEGHARLLVLHPKDNVDDRIDVTLTEVSFDDLGKDSRGTIKGSQEKGIEYEALSYHWNYEYKNEETLRPIHIRNDPNRMLVRQPPTSDGSSGNAAPSKHVKQVVDSLTSKTMFVKPNLHHALRRLRIKTAPVTLWVDALCINQEDQREKQCQVSRMKDIYSKASSVLIWLGESDDRTKMAIPFVKEVINLPALNDLVTNETRVKDWRNLIHLMRRSWFSRRWVIQELALASNATVHCGSDTVHWNDFRDAISIFSHEFERVRSLFKRSEEYDHDFYAIGDLAPLGAKVLVDTINNIFRKKNKGTLYQPMQSLEYLVSTLSAFGSSDPRDTIHALNNIARETSRARESRESSPELEPPQPDYKKTLLQVYTAYVSWVVKTTDSIDIICRRWAIPERSRQDVKHDINYPKYSALPSWIQQISATSPSEQIKAANGRIHGDTFVGLPGRKSYDACNGRSAIISFSPDRQASDFSEASLPSPEGRHAATRSTELHGPSNEVQLGAAEHERTSETPGKEQDAQKAGTGDVLTVPSNKKRPRDDEPSDTANVRHKRSRNSGRAEDSRKGVTITLNGDRQEDGNDSDSDKSTSSSNSSASSDDFDWAEARVLKQLIEEGRDASMHVKGLLIGTVNDCTEPIADGVIPEKAVRKLRRASKNDADLMWRTLVAERGDHGENPPAWYQRACQECVVSHTSNGHINTKDLYQKSTHPDHVRKYLQRVQAVTWDRSFLEIRGPTSSDKMHGFGPGKTRKGDLVCILFGCSVPCVLRRRHDDEVGTYYLFIGEAYVYGIMDGEAVSSLTEEEIEQRQESFRML